MSSATLTIVLGGALLSVGLYMLLRRNVVRVFLGLAVLSNAINLLLLGAGGSSATAPPLIAEGATAPSGAVANALPQALVLTAIVIGFGLMSFALVLARRAYEQLGTADGDEMTEGDRDAMA